MARRKLEVVLVGDQKSLSKALGKSQKDLRAFGKSSGATGRAMVAVGKAGLVAGTALGGGLALGLKKSVAAFAESETIAKQTETVIRSTGKAANVTAKDVDRLAAAISRKSGMDDEAIAQGENLLLTFTRIRNETGRGNKIFDRTTRAAADLSAAMKAAGKEMSMSDAALQLGKALNDPAAGMSRLQRIGVTFTQDQKDQAKALQESGDILGAQKIILRELNKEFGGSAKAAGDTTAGAFNKLKVAAGNVSEAIGAAVAPSLAKGATAVAKFVTQIQTGAGAGGRFRDKAVSAFNAVKGAIQSMVPTARSAFEMLKSAVASSVKGIKDLVKGFKDGKGWAVALVAAFAGFAAFAATIKVITLATKAWAAAQVLLNVALMANPVGLVIAAVVGLGVALVVAYKKSKTFRSIVNGAFKGVKAAGKWLVQAGKDVAAWVTDAIGDVKRFARGVAKWVDNAAGQIKRFPGKAIGFLKSLPGRMLEKGKEIIQGLIDGIKEKAAAVVDTITGIADGAVDAITGALDIFSPSKVFKGIGHNIVDGLIEGILTKRDAVTAGLRKGLLFPIDAAIAALNKKKETLQKTWDKFDARRERAGILRGATSGGGSGPGGAGNLSGTGPGGGLQWAKRMVGHFAESSGSNTGPELDQLQKKFGFHAAAWCFGAATLISTPAGLLPIDTLNVGDRVHSASGNVRAVTAVNHRAAPVLNLVAYGIDGTTVTAEHPYWARKRTHQRHRQWAEPAWVPAGELSRGDLIAIPDPQSDETVPMDNALAYVVGRYLADGWQSNGRVMICSAHDEATEVHAALEAAGLRYSVKAYPTVTQFTLGAHMRDVLADCGTGAHSKRVPAEANHWPVSARAALMRGYFDGDGSTNPTDGQVASSVCRRLIYGIAEIARSIGRIVKIRRYRRKPGACSTINGRRIPASPVTYFLALANERSDQRSHCLRDGDTTWAPVRSVTGAGEATVYNLTVAEDETFIADGAAVHNCAMFATEALVKSGAPKELRTASVAQIRAWAQAGTHGLQKGMKQSPRIGDLMLFGNDHVGVVEKIVNGIIHTIEGNTSAGKVARRQHRIGEGDFARVVGFGGGRGGGGSRKTKSVLKPNEIRGLAYNAGFRGQALDTMVAIVMAESGGKVRASNRNSNGTIDRGLAQINSVHGGLSTFNPRKNLRSAFKLFKRRGGFGDWVTFNQGLHRQFMGNTGSGTGSAPAGGGGGGGGNAGNAIKSLREFNREAKRAKILAKIDIRIAKLEQLRAFKDAVKGIREQVKSLAAEAASVWRASQEKAIESQRTIAHGAIANSAQAKELARLEAESKADADAEQLAQLEQSVKDAQYLVDHSGGKTKEDAKKQLTEAEDELADYKRDKRAEELSAWIDNENAKADAAYDKQTANLDAEEAAYAASLETRLGALTTNLAKQKTTYAKWAREVNEILKPYGLGVQVSAEEEATINAGKPGGGGKGGSKMFAGHSLAWWQNPKNAKKRGKWAWPTRPGEFVHSKPFQGRAMGGPVMGGTPYVVGERGPEVFVPDASGRIVPNHRLGNGGGVIVQYNAPVYIGSRKAAEVQANKLARRVAFG